MKKNTQVIRTAEKHLSSQRSFQGIPGIALTPGGRLWAVWYSGGTGEGKENYSILSYSDDKGESWTDAVFATEPEGEFTRSYDPALWTDPDGKLHFFWTESTSKKQNCISDGLSGVWEAVLNNPDESVLDRMQWSKSRKLANGIMLNKPIVLSNGTWLYPVSVWAPGAGGAPFRKAMQGFVGAGLYASTDKGKTCVFRGRARCTHGNIFDEHRFAEQQDGSIRCWIRTMYGYAESVSVDGGYNWSSPAPSEIPGPNSRMCVQKLASGNLLCIVNKVRQDDYAKGDWRPRRELIARISADDGKTWQGELMLDEREGVSYPDADQAPDGTIYAIYDHNRAPNGEIWMARFTEKDVLAGKIASKESRLKILVSKSTGKVGECQ